MPCPSAEDGPPSAAAWPNRMASEETPTSSAAAGRAVLTQSLSARLAMIANADGRMGGALSDENSLAILRFRIGFSGECLANPGRLSTRRNTEMAVRLLVPLPQIVN